MPPSWHPVPASTPRLRCRRAILHRHDDCAASIRKFGPEIKNRCTKEGVNEEKHASIRKFGLEIKNRCRQKDVSGEKLASIRKSGLEIKNRCTKQPIFSTHHQHIPRHAFHHALKHASCLGCCMERARAGLTVAAKAGADAPGGGISLCFCRRGCAAPAQKAATLNGQSRKRQQPAMLNARPQRPSAGAASRLFLGIDQIGTAKSLEGLDIRLPAGLDIR